MCRKVTGNEAFLTKTVTAGVEMDDVTEAGKQLVDEHQSIVFASKAGTNYGAVGPAAEFDQLVNQTVQGMRFEYLQVRNMTE